jgi:nucleoside-diphosphate-sugar epimerase
MSIVITGSTGFIGQNLIDFFKKKEIVYDTLSLRNELYELSEKTEVVIHLAGKAHDLKKVSNESEYYHVNTELTKTLYDKFLVSNAKTFIYLSSIKAVSDNPLFELDENFSPNPLTSYGKSKLLAEKYILENNNNNKKVYILRPCMVHGIGNKGNLNLLYKLVKKGVPYPLGRYENKRSYLSIANLLFIISELLTNNLVESGVYHVADDEPLSTKKVVSIMYRVLNRKPIFWFFPKKIIRIISLIGDILNLPINSEKIQKLTENYIVSNKKIKQAIGKKLPFTAEEGLVSTIKSFQ